MFDESTSFYLTKGKQVQNYNFKKKLYHQK